MKGTGLICLKVDQHHFHEHATAETAKAEAIRLAERLESDVVVYVPVLRVVPPKAMHFVTPDPPADARAVFGLWWDDLPF